ncbi:hypothetical protein [Nocardioides sp. L-11A]|uniref:hypothetical protein n=1 Tax=Nocardioides sp. L-11A TaxID=3043848 RepID=UPI00249B4889|nr:hypothetical protein QJ852_07970 [Nocardioides sp. L-11A]
MGMSPLPGDPHTVAVEAGRMVDAAERMRNAAKLLTSIGRNHAMRSDAVEELRHSATEVATVMTNASVRYQGTGEALVNYAPALDAAQKQAKQAMAQLGSTDVGHAQQAVDRATLDPWEHATLSADEKSQRAVELANAKTQLAEQQRAAADAWVLYEDAKRDLEAAAQTAMRAIDTANDTSRLNDTPMDDWNGFIDKYVAPVLEALAVVADLLGDILGMIAAIMAIIPGLQGVAAVLGAVAIGLKVAAFLATFALAMLGKKSWGDVVKAGIKLAISIVTKGAKGPMSPIQRLLGEKPGDLVKTGLAFGFKYGTSTREHPGNEYGVDLYQAVTEPGYRDGLTSGDYAAELFTVGMDPVGYAVDEATDALGGMVDDLDAPAPLDISGQATVDVTPLQADFRSVDLDRIMAQNFGSSGGEPAGVGRFSGGGGGGGGGAGW